MRGGFAAAAAAITFALAPVAPAQDPSEPVGEGAVEQSCRTLTGGTAGLPDQAPGGRRRRPAVAAAEGGGELPASWPEAPAGLLPERVFLRTPSETFNRLYEFATRGGTIYGRTRDGGEPWRELPLPPCFAGRVASISLDDDELVALDTARRIFTMDNVLKDAALFNWTARWGTPVWTGPGYALPGSLKAWAWSVVSPLEDGTWTDPAGNKTAIGAGKVSHIWGLRSGGRRITFWDPWLPLDESYEMCGPAPRPLPRGQPERERLLRLRRRPPRRPLHPLLRLRHLRPRPGLLLLLLRGPVGQRRRLADPAPGRALDRTAEDPGPDHLGISIHKTGTGSIHRILRVEGRRGGETGYWERDVAAPPRTAGPSTPTGPPLTGRRLNNPPADTSRRGLAKGEDVALPDAGRRYAGRPHQLQRLLLAREADRPRGRRDPRAPPPPRRRPAPAGRAAAASTTRPAPSTARSRAPRASSRTSPSRRPARRS